MSQFNVGVDHPADVEAALSARYAKARADLRAALAQAAMA
jgi:hypothetical protein